MKERISEEFCELIEDQLDKMIKKGDISPSEMDNAYKAVKSVYYLTVLDEMKQAKEHGYDDYARRYAPHEQSYMRGGYSRTSMYSQDRDGHAYDGHAYDGHAYDGHSMDGRDADMDGHYSEARRRDSRGRYMSRDDERENMKRTIEEMKQKLDHMG